VLRTFEIITYIRISDYCPTCSELETKEFSASAGGGAVEVTINGKKEITSIKLAEEIVDPEDIETLQDAIVGSSQLKHCARRMKPMQNLWAK